MKVVEQENFSEISDYITNVKECTDTAKKLLVILQKQRDTLKESVFKFMIKEVRYELLQLLESMGKKANLGSKKTKDDVERDVFMVCCETMTDELKTVGIREEWTMQQKHLAEMQNLILEINRELSLHNNHCFTQGSVLIGILSKIFQENCAVDQLLDSAEFLELLHIMGKNFYLFFMSHSKECTCSSSNDGHKLAIAICTAVLYISNNTKGRRFLLKSCTYVIQRLILSLPLIKCRAGEKIKPVLLELFLNLAESGTTLVLMKDFHCVFDCFLNQTQQPKETLHTVFKLLDKVIDNCDMNAGGNNFLSSLKQRVTPATLEKLASENPKIKNIVQRLIALFNNAESESCSCGKKVEGGARNKITMTDNTKSEETYMEREFFASLTRLQKEQLERESFYCSCASLTETELSNKNLSNSDEEFTVCACSSPKQSKPNVVSVSSKSSMKTCNKTCQMKQVSDEESVTCCAVYTNNKKEDNSQLVPYDYKGKEIVPYKSGGQSEANKGETSRSSLRVPPRLFIKSEAHGIVKGLALKQRVRTRIKLLKQTKEEM